MVLSSRSRFRARVLLKTLRVVRYLCPVWLFGPLLYLSLNGMTEKESGGSEEALDALSGLTHPVERVVVDTVSRNETLSDIFLANDISYAELIQALDASQGVFNLNRLRSGSVVKLVFDDEAGFKRLEYEIDDRCLLVVNACRPDSMTAEISEVEYQYRRRLISGTIESSLFQAVYDMDEDADVAYQLTRIFAWQVDFATDLRKGDSFRAILEEYWGRDGVPRLNNILAAEFYNNGKFYQGFRYKDSQGRLDYYDGTGASLRRKFLKSPLRYTRISSRFSRRRFHPILKVYRPHLGVDYAAPTGTPVVTVGEGEVVFAGRQRGFGNIVKIRHNGIYQTTYAHLKGFARGIRKGSRVKQGQVIGYVGSTGLATGPHLDFRLSRRGNFVDPLTVDLPAGDPVRRAELVAFRTEVMSCLEALDTDGDVVLAQSGEKAGM